MQSLQPYLNKLLRKYSLFLYEIDYDVLLKTINDPDQYWYDRNHFGDCTREPTTCFTCVIEDIEDEFLSYGPINKLTKNLVKDNKLWFLYFNS